MTELEKFCEDIMNGNVKKVKLKLFIYKNIINKILINNKNNEFFPEDIIENIFKFLNKKIYNKLYGSHHSLVAALVLFEEEKLNEGRQIIDLLLNFNDINVSFIIKFPNWDPRDGIEKHTLFHMIGEGECIPKDVCELILNHKSMNLDTLNLINHDDYRPLDLADHYNKDIVELMESKGALRHWRVGPGFKPKDNIEQ